MASNKTDNESYNRLRSDLKAATPQRLYAFYGEERYLLSYCLAELRKMIPRGTEEFNYRRFDGKTMTMTQLGEAVEALPVFAPMTLTEIWDFDISRMSEDTRTEMLQILSDIPSDVCVVFVFETVEFKLDSRIKSCQKLKKLFTAVEFCQQGKNELTIWTAKHFKSNGKTIDRQNAEYLAFITGGLMTGLSGEIEKLCAYAEGDTVTRTDIDAVVTPVLEATAYELTDCILSGKLNDAMIKLRELFSMNEAPHKIMYSIAMTVRRLFYAKLLQRSGKSLSDLMDICEIRYEFQGKKIYSAAKNHSMKNIRELVRLSAETAYKLNSTGQDGEELVEECLLIMAVILSEG